MDFVLVLICIVLGAVGTLAAQWYLFHHVLMSMPYVGPPEKPKDVAAPFSLPQRERKFGLLVAQHEVEYCGLIWYRELEQIVKDDLSVVLQTLRDALQDAECPKQESCLALNLILQFLFQELRHTEKVRKWFYRKLSLEFEELLTRTTTGKLFDSIVIRDLHLGSHFPTVRSISIRDVSMDPINRRIDTLELCLDLHYSGSFQLSLDASMVLGRTAYLSVTVCKLVGQARLQFTRLPYTHWSFSFYTDPVLQLQVESQFHGRPLQQITSIIINQIRKALKRKHTLPNHKFRYKPFFTKSDPGEEESEYAQRPVQQGILEVTIVEVTRISGAAGSVYCSLAVDDTAWVEMVQSDTATYMTLDVTINKTPNQQLGVIFKQEFIADRYQACVVLDNVTPGSPASLMDIRVGDLLVAVDGRKVSTITQAAKFISRAGDKFTLRIERRISLNVPQFDDSEFNSSQLSVSGDSPNTARAGVRHRFMSVDQNADKTDSDSSTSSPANSLQSSPAKVSNLLLSPSLASSSTASSLSPEHHDRVSPSTTPVQDGCATQMLYTKELPAGQVLDFNETLSFNVGPQHRYLNVSVWGISSVAGGRDQLLGHVSVPLASVAAHCAQSRLGHYIKAYSFLPPDPYLANSRNHKLSGQSGFEPCLCYGDVLLSFVYTTPSGGPPSSRPASSPVDLNLQPAPSKAPGTPSKRHDFIRTQFQRATQCGFCGKKIWLKDAVQCRNCALSCHKKCVSKCLVSLVCQVEPSQPTPNPVSNAEALGATLEHRRSAPSGAGAGDTDESLLLPSSEQPRRASIQPEIITTSADDSEPIQQSSSSSRRRIASILASVATQARGLKRVGSAHNLVPPGADSNQSGGHISRSLPPSPQHSPSHSRKTSLHENVFQFSEWDSGDDEDATADGDCVSLALQQLLQLRRPSGGAGPPGAMTDDGCEDLMAIAKATGKELYSGLAPTQRKGRINKMIARLKATMDKEHTTRTALCLEEAECQDPVEKARLAFLIGQCDEKVEAITVLMLHFCAGLQHTQDQEDQQQREALQMEAADIPPSANSFMTE